MAPAPKATGKKAKSKYARYKQYEISGSTIKRKNTSCPKCGPGHFLGSHKNRKSCGSCGYTEFSK